MPETMSSIDKVPLFFYSIFMFDSTPSDFGLATELKDSKKASDGLYKLTELTGSPRYV